MGALVGTAVAEASEGGEGVVVVRGTAVAVGIRVTDIGSLTNVQAVSRNSPKNRKRCIGRFPLCGDLENRPTYLFSNQVA